MDLSLSVPDAPSSGRDGDLGDPAEGEWLFKQGDVVLGPVAASVLVERLEQGELDGETPIGREAGKWRPLSAVPYFAEIYEEAAEKRRREAERRAHEAKVRRARALRVVGVAAIAIVPLFAGALLGRTLMIKRPWDDSEEWLQRAPPLVDLPPRPAEEKKPPEPPPVDDKPAASDDTVASADDKPGVDEPERDDADDKRVAKKGKKGRKGAKGRGTRLARADKRDTKADDKRDTKADKRPDKADDKPPAKLPESLTSEQVTAGLTKGKGGIGQCLKAEVGRNPDMPNVVTLMFTVTEEGRATNIKLKEREVRSGPLAECLVKVVSKLRWPKFTGERKNAEFPFRIKR